jgi:hypothetical protein
MNALSEDLRHARADARADLVRRLFAIAISVGFAATLARMTWVQNGRLPDPAELNQTIALATALLATILSWDGPLVSMCEKPLFGFWRFLVNIALVFIFMFLLMASMHPGCLLWTLAVVFVLYVVWDVLTIREHVASYDRTLAGVTSASVGQIWNVYVGGLLGRARIASTPVVTLAWALYFVLLAIIADGRADAHVRTSCLFALIGVVGYRLDEAGREGEGADGDMLRRSLIVAGALIAALIYFRVLLGM